MIGNIEAEIFLFLPWSCTDTRNALVHKWRTRDWLGCKRVIGHNRWIIIHLMLSSIHFSVDSAESGPETNMSSPYTNASGAVRAFNTCKCV